ncbi:MAG: hypothetical protein ACE5I1_33155, partial [bacterium]
GFQFISGLFAAAAILGTGLFVSMGTAVLYGWLLRIFSPHKLKNMLAYMQFGISFIVYGGYIFLPKLLENYSSTASIEKEIWLLLLPTTWFASLLEIGYGSTASFEWVGAGSAVVLLLILLKGAVSRISLDYAQRISALSGQNDMPSDRATTVLRRSFSFRKFLRRPENRVIAKLVYAQFRYDNKFKLSILGIIPLLVVVYFYRGLQEGTLPDPFIDGTEGLSKFFLFFFALLMLPLIMKQNLEMSDAFEASWVFYAAPVDISRLIIAARNALFLLLVLPSLIFILALFNHYFETSLHALLHTLSIAAISFFFLQIVYLVNPRLPFAEPKARGGRSRMFTALFIILPLSGLGLLFLGINFVYISAVRMGAAFAGFTVVILFTERMIRYRVDRMMNKLQFEA